MTNLRKFGIELECFNPGVAYHQSGANIQTAIQGFGYPAKFQPNHHFATEYDKWQIKPDSTLGPRGYALEVVSRTLPARPESLEEVRKIASWLTSNGYDVNQSCGYHIHIDAKDLSLAEIAAVSYRYNERQAEFNAILPASRHSNTYCTPLARTGGLDKVRSVVLGADDSWSSNERYTPVNLQHATRGRDSKRIEFRQHSGTINADKILGWYKLLCDFIDETVRIVRATANQPVASATPAEAVIVRRQRTARRVRTRSEVVGFQSGQVPAIEVGTDYDLFLNRLLDNGVVTQADAREFGWNQGGTNSTDSRLRVTAHWLRRHGAALVTTQRNNELAYVGQNAARTRDEVFTNPAQVRRRLSVDSVSETPVAAPVVARGILTSVSILTKLGEAELLQGASPDTVAWYRARREDFAGVR